MVSFLHVFVNLGAHFHSQLNQCDSTEWVSTELREIDQKLVIWVRIKLEMLSEKCSLHRSKIKDRFVSL